jgi:hypothetical protein
MMTLLSESRGNAKLLKSERQEYRIRALCLEPGSSRVCPHATESCRISCVGGESSGLASVFPTISASRQRKTEWLFRDPVAFRMKLWKEIERELRIAENDNEQLVLRLNTFSDLDWSETAWEFSEVIFYDYTKIHTRWDKIRSGDWPANYHLTFSWSENPRHQAACSRILREGGNVAIAFANIGRGFCGHGAYRQQLPGFWVVEGQRYPVYDGDDTDLRFLDPTSSSWRAPRPGSGWIIGLRLKSANEPARSQAIASGFAVTYDPESIF